MEDPSLRTWARASGEGLLVFNNLDIYICHDDYQNYLECERKLKEKFSLYKDKRWCNHPRHIEEAIVISQRNIENHHKKMQKVLDFFEVEKPDTIVNQMMSRKWTRIGRPLFNSDFGRFEHKIRRHRDLLELSEKYIWDHPNIASTPVQLAISKRLSRVREMQEKDYKLLGQGQNIIDGIDSLSMVRWLFDMVIMGLRSLETLVEWSDSSSNLIKVIQKCRKILTESHAVKRFRDKLVDGSSKESDESIIEARSSRLINPVRKECLQIFLEILFILVITGNIDDCAGDYWTSLEAIVYKPTISAVYWRGFYDSEDHDCSHRLRENFILESTADQYLERIEIDVRRFKSLVTSEPEKVLIMFTDTVIESEISGRRMKVDAEVITKENDGDFKYLAYKYAKLVTKSLHNNAKDDDLLIGNTARLLLKSELPHESENLKLISIPPTEIDRLEEVIRGLDNLLSDYSPMIISHSSDEIWRKAYLWQHFGYSEFDRALNELCGPHSLYLSGINLDTLLIPKNPRWKLVCQLKRDRLIEFKEFENKQRGNQSGLVATDNIKLQFLFNRTLIGIDSLRISIARGKFEFDIKSQSIHTTLQNIRAYLRDDATTLHDTIKYEDEPSLSRSKIDFCKLMIALLIQIDFLLIETTGIDQGVCYKDNLTKFLRDGTSRYYVEAMRSIFEEECQNCTEKYPQFERRSTAMRKLADKIHYVKFI
ncbi:hypothetical protein SBOR_4499 [Sclerotinia borealis F-4128]|uniref:Uncharacterized protein n=1 Tax=Sclerotinia borealis (strain F-4128) TaxID=1432307 RepID=W9CED9_SCLBF|nr:hypothetical protein SBOR_4499 [Sclerotinia borealis F-4128]